MKTISARWPLWPKLKSRSIAAALPRHRRLKFEEAGQPTDQIACGRAAPATVEAGPFKVQFVPVSHSIPESSALIIDTPAGRIVHSGDFKLDGNPVVGEAFDARCGTRSWHERPVKA
jgi:ribonuclease J